ncbi:hypothetical protein BJY17_002359 [Agromyces hippuratus]|uniref:DUF3995 domain-containing protein n=1 Tax=Agromyces hippuratus TaxID=286438 RepID=A0A852WTL6_9MICO|nr:DUF3995 domain-containing protein [Agromyces hippuratus]NYG21612.1 hypothetical protein [Agromyces hippuratus]
MLTSRAVAAVGLVSVGVLHAVWASGASWPAKSRTELADATVGSASAPPAPVATALVAATATAAGIVAGGALGDRPIAVLARRAAGLALLTRAAIGGVVVCRALGLPDPSERFRTLDARFYRPVCLMLGAAALVGARRRSSGRAPAS